MAYGAAHEGAGVQTDDRYEYRVLRFDRSTSRSDTRRALTEQAEYGRWELHRSTLYVGGERRVMLRRRIMRVRSTL